MKRKGRLLSTSVSKRFENGPTIQERAMLHVCRRTCGCPGKSGPIASAPLDLQDEGAPSPLVKSAACGGLAGSTWAGKEGAGRPGRARHSSPWKWLMAGGVRAKPRDHRFPGDPRDKGDIGDSIKLSGGKGVTSLSHSCPCFFPNGRQRTRLRSVPEKLQPRQCWSQEALRHGRSLQAFEDRVHVGLAPLGIRFRKSPLLHLSSSTAEGWGHSVVSSQRASPESVFSGALILGTGPDIRRHSMNIWGYICLLMRYEFPGEATPN